VRPGGQFAPQPVIDADQGLDDKMRKVMDDVNWAAPGDPVNLQIGTVPVARPGSLHQGDLRHWQDSTALESWQPVIVLTSSGSLAMCSQRPAIAAVRRGLQDAEAQCRPGAELDYLRAGTRAAGTAASHP
jgi:membrane-associated protease RseP (regulator of RpoE activity)